MKSRIIASALASSYIGLFAWNPTFATVGLIPPAEFINAWPDGMSMPEGRYVYAHPLPSNIGDVVVVKGAWQLGFVHNNLIKRVAGTEGMTYCWSDEAGTHFLDGREMPPPLPDDIRRGVPVWKGCRTLLPGEIVGYGEHPSSYDGRHFGPLPASHFLGVYRLVP